MHLKKLFAHLSGLLYIKSQETFWENWDVLSIHNTARQHNKEFGLIPLLWDEKLASEGQSYAETLASNSCALIPSSNLQSHGENIARSASFGDASLLKKGSDFVTGWVNEGNPGVNFYNHWSQVNWRTSERVGCGSAVGWIVHNNFNFTCNVFVCKYYPRGNCEGNLYSDAENLCFDTIASTSLPTNEVYPTETVETEVEPSQMNIFEVVSTETITTLNPLDFQSTDILMVTSTDILQNTVNVTLALMTETPTCFTSTEHLEIFLTDNLETITVDGDMISFTATATLMEETIVTVEIVTETTINVYPTATSTPKITLTDWESEALRAHNEVRLTYQDLGVEPLIWNASLARDGQEYAKSLALNHCSLIHSRSEERRGQGENLAHSAAFGDLTLLKDITEAVNIWDDEGNPGENVYNHWSQVNWRTTRTVGCGMAVGWLEYGAYNFTCNVFVCRYFPEGNCVGSSFSDANSCGHNAEENTTTNDQVTSDLDNSHVSDSNNEGEVDNEDVIVEDPINSTEVSRSLGKWEQDALDSHNRAREAYANVGVKALIWDSALAADGQAYADELAQKHCNLYHSKMTDRPGQGENLGQSAAYGNLNLLKNITGVVNMWNDEGNPGVNLYNHWSQVNWRNTQTVGCGTATGWLEYGPYNFTCNVFVCRYSPP
ncbi:hypothetical protein HDU92_001661 [Lobulomyces angularis]|nr:hypothetical protein HDU92_001661 [Lobulomyces angularis]